MRREEGAEEEKEGEGKKRFDFRFVPFFHPLLLTINNTMSETVLPWVVVQRFHPVKEVREYEVVVL